MADVTFKCPSCGSYLQFDPGTQKWKCPYCESVFEEAMLLEKDAAMQQSAQEEKPETVQTSEGTQVVYHCENCGSVIMTDETTVATHCYYCHSPVVLQGKLTDDMRPDRVLPFTVTREQAIEKFLEWVKGKKYVPKAFFSEDSLQNMSGVYYPHFVSDCEVDAQVNGEGRDSTVMEDMNYVTTITKHFNVHRRGTLKFNDVMRSALTSANQKLSDGIHPFPLNDAKPFAGAYLTGFLAERRDIDKQSIRDDVKKEVGSYVLPMLSRTVNHQSSNLTPSGDLVKMDTEYVMLPTWVLTYPNPKDRDDPYYYAMNGCTGKICGKLPIDKGKLWRTVLIAAAAVFAVGCLICYFLV